MKDKIQQTIPLVSVVIPIYNGEEYLKECVRSVQQSTFKNFEVLLLDDGSTDASKQIAKTLTKEYDNIRFYSFSINKGMPRLLNMALKIAKGKYICRLNQDDIMLPERMKKQVQFLQNHPEITVVGSHIKLFNQTKELETISYMEKDADIQKSWYFVSPFADPAVMYRKDVVAQAGGYQASFWPAEDLHMWYRLGKVGHLANIQEVLTMIRWHHKSASHKFFKRQIINTFKVHRWADKHIQKASFLVKIYWVIQLISGIVLGAKLNWLIYKKIKTVITYLVFLFNKIAIKTTIKSNVIAIPKKLNLAGS